MAKSFLERIQPSRQRWKLVDWPFPVEGDEKLQVKVRVLGQNELEAAYLAAVDHFKARKPIVGINDPAFAAREHVEIVWRAFSEEGDPLGKDADALAMQPQAVIEELYATYSQFAQDAAAFVATSKQMEELIELLKKNGRTVPLHALSSSWLIELTFTLASQPSTSTPESDHGS